MEPAEVGGSSGYIDLVFSASPGGFSGDLGSTSRIFCLESMLSFCDPVAGRAAKETNLSYFTII